MWNTRSVRLDVRLPADVADEVESVQHSDPGFVAQVLTYGFARRSAYRALRDDPSTGPAISPSQGSPSHGPGGFVQQ